VEKILSHRLYDGHIEYLLKWKGYPEDDATWEPEKHIGKGNLILAVYKEQHQELQSDKKAQMSESTSSGGGDNTMGNIIA